MKKIFLNSLTIIIPLLLLGVVVGVNYLRDYNSPLVRSQREANNYLNEQIMELTPVMDSVQEVLKDLRVFTNDDSDLELYLRPNLEVRTTIGLNFVVMDAEGEAIEQFLKKRDSLGFNLYLKTPIETYLLMNLTRDAQQMEQEYKVIGSYYFSKEFKSRQEERLRKRANDNTLYAIDIDEDIAALDQFQSDIAVASMSEINNRKLDRSIARMMAPAVDTNNPSYLVYIATYNKTTTKKLFEHKLPEIIDMFFIQTDSLRSFRMRELDFLYE